MSLTDLVIMPVVFGLIGFVTPCSLGVNFMLLTYVAGEGKRARVSRAAVFTVVRVAFLSLVGFSLALLGSQVFEFQRSYNQLLGVFFIGLGAWVLLSHFHILPTMPMLAPGSGLLKYSNPKGRLGGIVAMGAAFGLMIPACDAPFVMAMLSKTLLAGDLGFGTLSLLIFGLATALPLFLLSFWNRASDFLGQAKKGVGKVDYLVALALIIAGVLSFSPRLMWLILSLPARLF